MEQKSNGSLPQELSATQQHIENCSQEGQLAGESPPQDSRLRSGKPTIKIGNYILKETLGRGTFGKVKLAEHQLTGHKVAVKILNRKKIRSLNMDAKVRREISIMKLFAHPHVIRLYEVIGTERNIFMIMQYVSGGEMFDYIIKRGKLHEDQARRFFQQIISGVEYCHRHMVVHRDLKPENLLLDENCNVKIADFGLSNMMRDGDFLSTSCGSPNYAAPEVVAGKLYVGPGVDIWSCGVILYALLCARLPFDDSNMEALFQKIKTGSYVLPSYLPSDARDLVARMLTVDPMRRITMTEIRHHPWFLKNLPDYLSMSFEELILNRYRTPDEQVLQEICAVQTAHHPEACLRDLQGPNNMTQVSVMYNLITDQKRNLQLGTAEPQQQRSPADDQQPSAYSAAPSPSSRAGTPPGRSPSEPPRRAACDGEEPEPHWQLGVQSRRPPVDIMTDLFRMLRLLNFIRCHLRQPAGSAPQPAPPTSASGSASGSRPAARTPVEIHIQLYAIPNDMDLPDTAKPLTAGAPPKGPRYLVDLRRISGDTFPFLSLCTALLGVANL
ncbi:putative SNF1-related protein kinase catalytic subunit alpha KIN10 [Paratrimastix pyriformis]|uniref:non-specific serine/threonine protein kinase n=1 Tax=Paratrimastix pyriformis TaxID=342808 RepID=A0ABQ8UE45_9EUKA|nr:putative SNF1-related protein kinase catalytic subunit alpha KIN10 [Paratrimastix pyriformis]